MSKFTVSGPARIPIRRGKKGIEIDMERISEFWQGAGGIDMERGCFVFAFRAAKGYKPVYVGKATKNFGQECFALHKLSHYHSALVNQGKGTPVMFFVVQKTERGKPNIADIDDLEKFLIKLGALRNPNLSNVHGKKQRKWGVAGVIGPGKPSSSAQIFRKLMDIY